MVHRPVLTMFMAFHGASFRERNLVVLTKNQDKMKFSPFLKVAAIYECSLKDYY